MHPSYSNWTNVLTTNITSFITNYRVYIHTVDYTTSVHKRYVPVDKGCQMLFYESCLLEILNAMSFRLPHVLVPTAN